MSSPIDIQINTTNDPTLLNVMVSPSLIVIVVYAPETTPFLSVPSNSKVTTTCMSTRDCI